MHLPIDFCGWGRGLRRPTGPQRAPLGRSVAMMERKLPPRFFDRNFRCAALRSQYDIFRARTAYNIAFPGRRTSWATPCPNMIAFGSVLGVLGAAPERFLFIMMGKMVEVGEGRSVAHVLREIIQGDSILGRTTGNMFGQDLPDHMSKEN